MTELEALAKDCIENHTHKLVDKPTKQDIYLREESIFIQGYRQAEKQIAELKNRDCWKSCEYANPKAELIGQHIKDVHKFAKAKELLNEFIKVSKSSDEDFPTDYAEIQVKAEQFLKEVE